MVVQKRSTIASPTPRPGCCLKTASLQRLFLLRLTKPAPLIQLHKLCLLVYPCVVTSPPCSALCNNSASLFNLYTKLYIIKASRVLRFLQPGDLTSWSQLSVSFSSSSHHPSHLSLEPFGCSNWRPTRDVDSVDSGSEKLLLVRRGTTSTRKCAYAGKKGAIR